MDFQKLLRKVISDFSKGPTTECSTVVLLHYNNGQWYLLLRHFNIVKQYPIGPNIFTCLSSSTYSPDELRPYRRDGGLDRVFVQGIPWPVIIIVNNIFTHPKLNHVQLLYVRLRHVAPSTLRSVISSGSDTGTTTKLKETATHFSSRSCSVCA